MLIDLPQHTVTCGVEKGHNDVDADTNIFASAHTSIPYCTSKHIIMPVQYVQ